MGQKDLKAYKEDYASVHMSEDQVEQMKKRMQQAKQETQEKKIIEMGKRGNRILKIGAAGSGSEEDYYYTIDLATGQRLALADLFKDGADYVTPISKNIKKQMRAQMKADENVMYWTDVYGLS